MTDKIEKPGLKEEIKDLAKSNKYLRIGMLAAVAVVVGLFVYKGDVKTALQWVQIGSEIALLQTEDGVPVAVVSATAPVSVTLVSDTMDVNQLISDTVK